MKGISLISGGKDSYLSLLIAVSVGMEIEKTITVKAKVDSEMFHYQNAELGGVISRIMGIENLSIEEDEFQETLGNFKGYFLVAGAVESEFQKTRLETICESTGLIPFFPLWRKNKESIIREFIYSGTKAIFVSVAAEGLNGSFLGRNIDEHSLGALLQLNRKYGISIIGEGGEYETLVTEIPLKNKCLKITESKIIDRGIQKNMQVLKYEVVNCGQNEKPLRDHL